MTFSIIIPVHNAYKYIDGAMKPLISAYEKGYQLEVILVENGSSDESAGSCDHYADRYDYVKSYHYGPIGAFRARLEGIKLAGGDYLVFCDSDDEVATDMFDVLSNSISSYQKRGCEPDIVVYNAADSIYREEKLFSFPFDENKVYSADEKQVFYDVMSSSDALNAMWNKAIRKDFARRTDCFEGLRLNHGEDLLQTAEFIDKADTIVFINRILYYYNQNSLGLTSVFHRQYMEDQICAWEQFDKYIRKWQCIDNQYTDIVDKRKTLTCAIAVSNLIYSGIPIGKKAEYLREMNKMPFYEKYATMALPDWAPEGEVFVYDLMNRDNPFRALMLSAGKFGIKRFVKRLLGWKEDINNGN